MIFIPPGLPPALAAYLGEDDDEGMPTEPRALVEWRIQKSGGRPLAWALGAKNVIAGLRRINQFVDVLNRTRPDAVEMHEGLREALREQLVAEFAFGFVESVFNVFDHGLRAQVSPRRRKRRRRWGGRLRWL